MAQPCARTAGMTGKATTSGKAGTAATRDDRLKAALKANIARRKAQAAARTPQTGKTGPKG